jgi:hypothetical protein
MMLRSVIAANKFTPKRLSPVAWYKGYDPNGTGVAPSNGATLSQLVDFSGNNYHFTQSTGSLQPTYSTNVYNGKGAVTFSGGRYFARAFTSALNGATMSIFIACAATANTGDFRSILTSRRTGVANNGYIFYAEPNTGTNKWSLWVGPGTSSSFIENDGASITLSQLVLLRGFTNVASNSFYVNGTAYNNNPSTAYSANPSTAMYLGTGESAAFPFVGNLLEAVILDYTLDSTQQSLLSGYFNTLTAGLIS